MTPQELQDEKDRRKAEKAYNAAMTNTPANPKKAKVMGGAMKAAGMKAGGAVKKLPFGAKTGIEAAAVEGAYKRDYDKYGPSQGASDDEKRSRNMQRARDEAVNEIRRETKGKTPAAYAKGGMVRGDGCAQRGKTKGRMI